MAVISINYDEGSKKKDLGYKSVNVSYANLKKKKVFASRDFVKDWYDCTKFVITEMADEPVSHSSSVNHFIMDGAKFDSAVLLTTETSEPILSYVNVEGIEFFVKENTKPTWQELRELCGDPFKPKK